MILADTSVWIDFWRHGGERFARALSGGHVLLHPFVRGEIALGIVARRGEALSYLDALSRSRLAEHTEVLTLIERARLWGRGIGWVDAHLLASALLDRAALWTRDQRLAEVAAELGIAA